MKQEIPEGSTREEAYTYKELSVGLMDELIITSEYTHQSITQERINTLPQMVRFANERKIKDLGLLPNVTDAFRIKAEKNNSLETKMPEDVYRGALKGDIPVSGLFKVSPKK